MYEAVVDNIISNSFYVPDMKRRAQRGNLSVILGDMFLNPTHYDMGDILNNTSFLNNVNVSNEREQLKPSDWALKYRMIKGKPMTFDMHRFQIPIINDMTPHQVVEKAAQLGLSEIMLTKVFWWADYHIGRANIIYTFPTFNDMCTYAAARIQPIIDDAMPITPEDYGFTADMLLDENKTYISTMIMTNNTQIKKIRDTFLFLKGTISDRNAISVDSDWNIHDEVNFSDQNVLNKFRSRIGAETSMGWEYDFSTPTIPGYGVSEIYQKSDQKRWYVKCPHCGKRQHMEFETHVVDIPRKSYKDKQEYKYICSHCKEELTHDTIIQGEFIAERPEQKDISGYHIDKMLVKSATALMESKEQYRRVADFYNFDLGRPYTERTISLSEDIIRECMVSSLRFWGSAKPEDGIVLGCDQGDTLWAIFSRRNPFTQKRQIVYMEEIDEKDCPNNDPFARLDELIRRYNVQCGVIDMNPNKNDVRKLCLKYPGTIFMATYAAYKGEILTFPNIEKGDMVVNIDRTEKFKECFNNIYIHNVELPVGTTIGEVYIQHLCNLKKNSTKDESTSEIKEWFEAIGPDHLAHANLYNEVAYEFFESVVQSDNAKRPMATMSSDHWMRSRTSINQPIRSIGYGDPSNPQVVPREPHNRLNRIRKGR